MLLKLINNLFQVRILQVQEIFSLQKTSEPETGAEQVHSGAKYQTGQEVTGEQANSPKKALSRILNVSKSNDSSFTACGLYKS